MKRKGYLIEQISDMDNLYTAFWKAQRGKHTQEVISFQNELTQNLAILQQDILNGSVKVGEYNYFTIYDPKKRLICACSFSERVLQHAIMNICHPLFEHYQIDTSYASRKGKGTYAAIKQARCNQLKYRWFLKMDVHKYFDSINHQVMKKLLLKKIKDKPLLAILFSIIDSYHTDRGEGLPIGNLSSQYFANHYLATADHYAKEELKATAYIRYMDDIVIWENDKSKLLEISKLFQAYLKDQLDLTMNPICLNKTETGLPFCGYRIYSNKMLLGKLSKRRFKSKYQKYNFLLKLGVWEQKDYQRHVIPLFAHVMHANTYRFRKRTIEREVTEGTNRVNRGGSYYNSASNCTVTYRNYNSPGNSNNNLGLRLALVPQLKGETDVLY